MALVSSAVVVVCVSCNTMSAARGAVIWIKFLDSDSEFAAGLSFLNHLTLLVKQACLFPGAYMSCDGWDQILPDGCF